MAFFPLFTFTGTTLNTFDSHRGWTTCRTECFFSCTSWPSGRKRGVIWLRGREPDVGFPINHVTVSQCVSPHVTDICLSRLLTTGLPSLLCGYHTSPPLCLLICRLQSECDYYMFHKLHRKLSAAQISVPKL